MTEEERYRKKVKLVYKALRKGTVTFNYHPEEMVPPHRRMLTLKYYLEDEEPKLHIVTTPVGDRRVIYISNIHVFRDELESYNFKNELSNEQNFSILMKLRHLIKKRFKENNIEMIGNPKLIEDK